MPARNVVSICVTINVNLETIVPRTRIQTQKINPILKTPFPWMSRTDKSLGRKIRRRLSGAEGERKWGEVLTPYWDFTSR